MVQSAPILTTLPFVYIIAVTSGFYKLQLPLVSSPGFQIT